MYGRLESLLHTRADKLPRKVIIIYSEAVTMDCSANALTFHNV